MTFPQGLTNGEDSIFISLVQLYVHHINFTNETLYLVNEREGSASRSWTFDRVYKMKNNIRFINNYIEKHPNLNRKQKSILDYSIYGIVSAIFNHLYYCFSIKNYLKILRVVRKQLNRKLDTGNITISKKKVRLLNLSLNWFSFTVLINQRFKQLSR